MNTIKADAIQHENVGVRQVGTQGTADMTLSSQWYDRPADQKFTDLNSLYAHVKARASNSKATVVPSGAVHLASGSSDGVHDDLIYVHADHLDPVEPTHWAFGQLCGLVGAPASYLRSLPATLAATNLEFGYRTREVDTVKAFTYQNGRSELRAMNGPKYGRIYDHQVVQATMAIAGNGTGDTRWKIPGVLDWTTGLYDPDVPITKESTTLFASDRDVFLFLCDDKNPIEIGKLPNGEPDYVCRGFYVWNSEVGKCTLGIATMLFRAVCQNRILWGVQSQEEMKIRHSAGAPKRFAMEAEPALERYAEASIDKYILGIQSAKEAVVADDEDGAKVFLKKQGFTLSESNAVLHKMFAEEGEGAKLSVWNIVQGVTALARGKAHQDERIDLEKRGAKLLSAV